MNRREFVRICTAGSGLAIVRDGRAAITTNFKRYERARLVDAGGAPLRARTLVAQRNYVFFYPYQATPCFLLNLDKQLTDKSSLKTANGGTYDWPGGVGAAKSIVAYSAICAHKMAYPTSQVSFISYRAAPSMASARGQVISCCADKSVYDPFLGAKVLSGPAPQPLAAILLEHDAKTDALYAVGTFGGEKFNEFFQKYDFKLTMDLGDKARTIMTTTTRLSDLAAFSTQTAQC